VSSHTLDIRVYYEDTDAAGMVYHARYLAFAERARTELLRSAGVPHEDLVRNEGLIFVVRRIKIDYLRPARLDEVLRVVTTPVDMKAATAVLRQVFILLDPAAVSSGGPPVRVAEAEVQLACVRGTDGRPSRIPARWRQAFDLSTRSGGL
jgi:acyl-CoA thioester hydrolase